MIKLEEFKKQYAFEPRYTFPELQQNLPQGFNSKIMDSRLYKAIEELTGKAYPTIEDKHDKRWLDFYLPLKRRGYFILVPLGIVQYDKRFFLSILHSNVEVNRGREKNEFPLGLIEQTHFFSQILKKNPDMVAKTLPYDIRTGRILGKYVLDDLLSIMKKEAILRTYAAHLKKGMTSQGVSLNEYLRTAAICYKAAFGKKTRRLTDEQMYNKLADGRDCGMLKIKDRNSRGAFRHWLSQEANCGGHPFEIVFSMIDHGIHLFPPSSERPYFALRVSNYLYSPYFLTMVKALIRNKVPFEAHNLEDVLDYLSGESYFTVNAHGKHNIDYPGERRLFKHIEWDEPNIVKWK